MYFLAWYLLRDKHFSFRYFILIWFAFNCYSGEDDDEDDNGNDSMTETNDADRMIEINEDYDVVIGKSTFYVLGKFGKVFWET